MNNKKLSSSKSYQQLKYETKRFMLPAPSHPEVPKTRNPKLELSFYNSKRLSEKNK